MTDFYQVCLVMFVWFITVPFLFFVIFAYFKDPTRYLLVPLVVGANLVFVLVCTILALIVVVFTLINGNSPTMRILTFVNCVILCWTILMNSIYRFKYSKKDLLRTDEQEIDV